MSIENVLALDLETTGLDEKLDGIMEFGAKIVAPDFTVVDCFRMVMSLPAEQYSRMSPEVTGQHVRSGLLEESRNSLYTLGQLAPAAVEFVSLYYPKGNAILLGNTIGFDRRFIKEQLPDLEKLLHYRMIDASSIREALRIFGSKHKVMEDIDNSIKQVREFVESVK